MMSQILFLFTTELNYFAFKDFFAKLLGVDYDAANGILNRYYRPKYYK